MVINSNSVEGSFSFSLITKFTNKKNLWGTTDSALFNLFVFDDITDTYYNNVPKFGLSSNADTFSVIDNKNAHHFFCRFLITCIKVRVHTGYENIIRPKSVTLNSQNYLLDRGCDAHSYFVNLFSPIHFVLPPDTNIMEFLKLNIESQAANTTQDGGFWQHKISDDLSRLELVSMQFFGHKKRQETFDVQNNSFNIIEKHALFINIDDTRCLVTIGYKHSQVSSLCPIKKIKIVNTFSSDVLLSKKPMKIKTYYIGKGKLFDMIIRNNYSLVGGIVPLIRFKKGTITTYKMKGETEKMYNFFFISSSQIDRLPCNTSRYIYVFKNLESDNDIDKLINTYNNPIIFD